MKKIIVSVTLTLLVTGVFAQESPSGMISKKGEVILPETNDWALSIDASPIITYFGNMLNGNQFNSSPSWGYPGTPLAITGKLFKDEKTAYRAMVRIGFGVTSKNNYVDDNLNTTDPLVMVKDSWTASHSNFVLGGGIEKRRGKTRLQGFYGGMLMIGLGGNKDSYTFGNNFSTANTTPTSTIWTPTVTSASSTSRITRNKSGESFMLGLRGFIGAEYFIFPKIAIGAEFGWGLGMKSRGEGEVTTQSWDAAAATPQVKSSVTRTGKSNSFGLDTDINGSQMIPTGALTLTMHF
jgi:hypothetical protein